MSTFKTKRLSKNSQESLSIAQEKKKNPIIAAGKKKKFSLKFFIGIFITLLSVFFVSQIALRALQGNEQNGSEAFRSKTNIFVEEFLTEKVAGTTNILIAGIGGKGHDGGDLTDSIMLASLNGENKTITLLSIPRDLYVSYPPGKLAGRINSLYDLGKRNKVGISYLADKVSEITGQPIDHYIVIDFSGFKKIIDILGGIPIDVPEDLVDREYPDNNWGYTTFIVRSGPQIFDGETALRYARSRHSTSDFDRSNRQQLLIKSIKEKATDLGIVTNITKLGEVYDALLDHLDTDLSIASMADIALSFSETKSEDIHIISLSDACFSMTKCAPGSYLYGPSRDLFGGSAVLIPENAHINKLSYYTDIRNFVDLTFHFPLLFTEPRNLVIITDPSMKKRAQQIGLGLAKFGFPLSFDKSLIVATGSIEKSHINIYWNSDLSVGINPESITVMAMKHIEEGLPYVTVERNEYANDSGPKIELILGKDAQEYFKKITPIYYIPAPPKEKVSSGNSSSGNNSKTGVSGNQDIKKEGTPTLSGENSIMPGEWENF